MTAPLRLAIADPPYPGCAHLYKNHPDFGGEVDHAALIRTLDTEYDGYVLHTSSTALASVLALYGDAGITPPRIMAWVKPFAAFKRNVSVAYTWEPVLVKAARKPVVTHRVVMRDFIEHEEESAVKHSITMKKGLTGAKPDAVSRWSFEMLGAHPDDSFHDLYPGTGAISRAWESWCAELRGAA